MQLILFIGVQGSGKSTFYARRFADTHIRINLDMLKTRHRERLLFDACLSARQPLVIDNTNPIPADRARYIPSAKSSGFTIVGYYFNSPIEDCHRRNESREPKRIVPRAALLGTRARLVPPTLAEGFDQLYSVRIDEAGEFIVETLSGS